MFNNKKINSIFQSFNFFSFPPKMFKKAGPLKSILSDNKRDIKILIYSLKIMNNTTNRLKKYIKISSYLKNCTKDIRYPCCSATPAHTILQEAAISVPFPKE